MWISDDNRLAPALAIICASLLLIIAIEFVSSRQALRSQQDAAKKVMAAIPSLNDLDYASPPVDELEAILERHLYMPDRRPAKAPAATVNVAPISLRLEGVAIISGSKIAVLRDLRSNQLLRLSEGMSHQDWELEIVDATGATFTRDEESVRLMLER